MLPIALFYRVIKYILLVVCVFLFAVTGETQIQVDLKFKRLQYIAYEPVVATLAITNLAGRDVDLHDADGQSWFGFEVTDARPIWQQTVGIPDGVAAPGNARTYALLTNRFPDHTSLYVRVQDRDSGTVYATYSLGRTIAFEEPQTEIDRANQLHVLHCAAPRAWSYSRIGLNGELLAHSSFMETKTRPRLVHAGNGDVAVRGGVIEAPAAQTARGTTPKLSDRPPGLPKDDR